MSNEEALRFVQERLQRGHLRSWQHGLHLWPRQRVRWRLAVRLQRGRSQRLEGVDRDVMVYCLRGSVWIIRDGDPKDVILAPTQSWRAERAGPTDLFALEACLLEIEFEDELLQ